MLLADLALLRVSGSGIGSIDLRLRLIQGAVLALIVLGIYALRRHRVLQILFGVVAALVVGFFVVVAQLASASEAIAARRASLIPKAPQACLPRPDSATSFASVDSEPQELGYPVKTLDRLSVRSLLVESSFDELDTLLTAYADSARADFRLEYRLSDAFEAFSTAAPELELFLNDWVKTRPQSGNARLARAVYFAASGWHARGANTIGTTAFRRIVVARSNFAHALDDIEVAFKRLPCSATAYLTVMDIAPFYADTAASREAMEQALRIQPLSFRVREEQVLNLRPRWGGSYEMMEQVATAADPLIDRNPRLKTLHGFVDWDRGDREERAGNAERAVEFYDHALSYGDFWRFRLERGEFLIRRDRYPEALVDLERARVQRPQNPRLLNALSSTKYALGRVSDQVEQYHFFYDAYADEALAAELDPAEQEYQESLAFYKKNIPESVHGSGG